MSTTTQIQRRQEQLTLILSDYLCLVAAFFIVHSIRFEQPTFSFFFTVTFSGMSFIMLFFQYTMNLYEPWGWRSRLFSPFRSAYAAVGTLVSIILVVYLLSLDVRGLIGRGILVAGTLLFYTFSLSVRYFLSRLYANRTKSKWLILAKNSSVPYITPELENANEMVSTKIIKLEANSDGALFLPDENRNALEEPWDGIVVEPKLTPDLLRKFVTLRLGGIEVLTIDRFFELFFDKIPIHFIDRAWFAFGLGFQLYQKRVHRTIKRALDIVVSSTVLFLTFPIMLLTAIAIKMESSGDALFSQQRVGENGLPFTIWKFRSMCVDAEKSGAQWAQQNDARITGIGKFIRLTRIDELPQLYNILRGDMSFIGPRPERPEFVNDLREKIPFYDIRHSVKPGLTGWAQINYPYGASVEDAIQKLQYEIFYIKNYSVLLDMKILTKTVQVVLFAKGR